MLLTSPNDHKQYRNLKLKNDLNVLLIHDASINKAAVSLAVNVGHYDDPDDLPGLAHLLEHMLLLGTKNHPDPGAFQQFIHQHGGKYNATTAGEFIQFFFDIECAYLEVALKHFSEFFLCPELSAKHIEQELQVIEAEFHLKEKEESRRAFQVHKETTNPQHPFSKFSVGNKETLSRYSIQVLQQRLYQFFQTHFLASRMTLVVVSHCSLEMIEKITLPYFTPIPSTVDPKANINEPLYHSDHLGIEIFVRPLQHQQKMVLNIPIPYDKDNYKNKTSAFLAYLIGFEGEQSFVNYLKEKDWIHSLQAGGGISGYNFREFAINIELTNNGFDHRNEIIMLFFSYIHHIRKNIDALEALYDDKKQLFVNAFNYQEKSDSLVLANHLAINMHLYAIEHAMIGDYLMEQYDAKELEQLLDCFYPENLRVFYFLQDIKTNQQTRWYHTKYRTHSFSKKQLALWTTPQPLDLAITLPTTNPYLDREIKLFTIDSNHKTPIVIQENEGFKFWFKQDQTFRLPKGYMYTSFDCPAFTRSPARISVSRLLVELFLDHVSPKYHFAELAGTSYHTYLHQGGLTLQTSGLSRFQPQLMQSLVQDLLTFKPTFQRYTSIKSQLIRYWQRSQDTSVKKLLKLLIGTLQPNNPSKNSLLPWLTSLSYDQFLIEQQQLLQYAHIEGFAYGNWQKSSINVWSQQLQKTIFTHSTVCDEVNRIVLSIQNQGSLYINEELPDEDNGIILYYQSPTKTLEATALMMLLNTVIAPQFFHTLRTEKQLGYLVGSGYLPLNQYPGLVLYVQSPHHQSDTLLLEIDNFCDLFSDQMTDLSAHHWQSIQKTLIHQLLESDFNMRSHSQQYWIAVGNKDIAFDHKEKLATKIKAINPQQLQLFTKQLFNPYSQDRVILTSDRSIMHLKFGRKTSLQNLSTELSPL